MRMSGCISDVGSADVDRASALIRIARERGRILQVGHLERFSAAGSVIRDIVSRPLYVEASRIGTFRPSANNNVNAVLDLMIHDLDLILEFVRSEEHTSELQSLMRISSADFCLTKKK